jgi:tRNA 2-selenouridine synthase
MSDAPAVSFDPRTLHDVGVEAIRDYPDRIDVRSPSEFTEDHVPGAVNHPVLNDEERARVGTIYTQESPFVARRLGAAIVSRNIAAMLEGPFADKPRDWAPLVYCWRGGQRSRSLAHILREVGWRAVRLTGGYRAYRRHVRAELETLPARYRFEVVCGLTGSGKSRLIDALAMQGAQVLDLEGIARHRGSLLGDLPDRPQPPQKLFDSELVAKLATFDASRPVYVESESKRIGSVEIPDALLAAMRASSCVRIDASAAQRVALLKEEYAHFLADPAILAARLAPLVALHGKSRLARWNEQAVAGDWDTLVEELLTLHYDPTYTRSIEKNFPRAGDALVVTPAGIDPVSWSVAARELDARVRAQPAPEPTAPVPG